MIIKLKYAIYYVFLYVCVKNFMSKIKNKTSLQACKLWLVQLVFFGRVKVKILAGFQKFKMTEFKIFWLEIITIASP